MGRYRVFETCAIYWVSITSVCHRDFWQPAGRRSVFRSSLKGHESGSTRCTAHRETKASLSACRRRAWRSTSPPGNRLEALKKGGGVDTIPSGSTISGESCSGGSLVKLLTSPCLIITSSVTTEAKRTQKQPANPFHPGEILLEEFLEPGGITQAAFATKVGWTKARLNELIKGKRGITADAALDLAETLGTSARLWMNLQSTFDLAQAEKKRRAAQP